MSGVQFQVSLRSRQSGARRALAAKGVRASEFLAAVEGRGAVAGPLTALAYRCSPLRVETPVCSAYVTTSSRSVALPKVALRATMLRLRLTRRAATVGRIARRLPGMYGKACVPKVA